MRKVNQDSYVVQKNFNGINDLWMMGVMDGHGVNGHQVSSFVKINLPAILTHLMNGAQPQDIIFKNNMIVNKK